MHFTRKTAFLWHLGASLLVFGVLLGLMLGYWFPPPLFAYDGGWQGVRIIVLVDVVLGPALTLLLFKPGKPGLKFDMTVVFTLQAVAMVWGIWTTYHARPVVEVFAFDTLYSVSYAELQSTGISKADFNRWVGFSPSYIYAEYPQEPEALADAIRAAKMQTGATFLDATRYRPMAEYWPQVRERGIDLGQYVARYADQKPQWLASYTQFAQAHAGQQVVFVPLTTRYRRVVLALDYADGRALAVLDIIYAPG
jgi:hypothetical protein